MGVELRLPINETPAGPVFFFLFLRDDSFPLESETMGDPGRLSDLPFLGASASVFLP